MMKLVAALLCVSACSGLALAQAPKVGLSPCLLLTKADVKEAAGLAVGDGAINAHNKAVCDYVPADGSGVMNVSVTPKGPGEGGQKMVDELKKRNIKAEVVAGLGDSAYASSAGFGMQQVGVFKGNYQVIVTVMLMSAPEAKAKAAAMALVKKALTKVP